MTIERKVGMGIAGQPSGGPTDVADVFSTYLYTGTGSAQTITNGIDLAGEGGLVWIKDRDGAVEHILTDTERGANKTLHSDTTAAEFTASPTMLSSFTSTGFSVGTSSSVSYTNDNYASFTFRKKSQFFSIITYSGNSATDQTINHNLGSTPAFMLVKRTDATGAWNVYHTSMGNQKYAFLNSSEPVGGPYSNLNWAVTDTTFSADGYIAANNDGATYVAYLFADNSSKDADDQMIKCGSFTGTGSAGLEVNLGWEPQWVLIKNTSRTSEWMMQDTMRGMSHNWWKYLIPNDNSAESGSATNRVVPTATGFTVNNNGGNDFGQSGDTLVYMAVRSSMMQEPEAATDVFHANASQGAAGGASFYSTGFDVDMAITKVTNQGASHYSGSRLAGSGQFLRTDGTHAEDNGGPFLFDVSDGVTKTGIGNGNDPYVTHMWKRAKGFFDVVAWNQPNDTANTLVNHSLGIAPEMIWTKCRDAVRGWVVYYGSSTHFLQLNQHYAHDTQQPHNTINETSFKVNGSLSGEIGGNNNYISYLFATLDGISKVGSYTGNGSSQTINCGFSAGSRFILIKRVDVGSAYEGWWLWDATRGIVAGNDPRLRLNHTGAQVTTDDSVDPHNSGFIVNQVSASNINVSSGTYIFYAIA